MKKVILVTFSENKERMELLRTYALKLINHGLIDEWHVWNFTKDNKDQEFVYKNASTIRYISSMVGYQKVATIARGEYFKFSSLIQSDLHIAIKPQSQAELLEYVVGGWMNGKSVIRKINLNEFLTTNRSLESEVFSQKTPGILSPILKNDVCVRFAENGILVVGCNDFTFPFISLVGNSEIKEFDIYVKGGFGFSIELFHSDEKIIHFIVHQNETHNFAHAYNYYTERYAAYSEDIFLKCDDNIVYMDINQIQGFINAIKDNPQYFIMSANVINNDVCAFFQQKAKNIPESIGIFECPSDDSYGSLRERGDKAFKLHDFFTSQDGKQFKLEKDIIEWDRRIAINFIGWTGDKLRYMNIPFGDDEEMLSTIIPKYLNKKVAIYSDFTVSHLSFYSQETTMDTDRVIALYRKFLEH